MKTAHGRPIDRIVSYSNYAPWFADQIFLHAYMITGRISEVDIFRCFELWKLIQQMGPVSGDIIEVGVWRGGTGILLGLAAREYLPNRIVNLCDTFAGVVKAGPNDPIYKGGEFSNTSKEVVERLIAKTGLKNARIYEGVFPDETAVRLSSEQFCLVHIDVDVYLSAKNTFEWVWPKVSPGGVVVFDDYGWVDCGGVIKFVEEEVRGQADRLMIHNLNGHAVILKR